MTFMILEERKNYFLDSNNQQNSEKTSYNPEKITAFALMYSIG